MTQEAEPQRIEWHGGECPVLPKTKVKVWFSNGKVNELCRAQMWTWKWSSAYPDYNIIAYATLGTDALDRAAAFVAKYDEARAALAKERT